MALFFYKVFSKEGKEIKGYIDASSLIVARDQLLKKGFLIAKLEQASENKINLSLFQKIFLRKVSLKDKIFFTKQLATLLKSGVPILQALELLSDQVEGSLKPIVISLKDSLKEGQSLAFAIAKYPYVFDTIYIQLVRAGEATGKLDSILERLVMFLERRQEIQKTISGALRYPIIQLSVILVVVSGLLYSVIPQIASVFEEQKASLPFATIFLINLSNIFINNFVFLSIGLILIFALYKIWSKTERGSYIIDSLKLKLPIFGYFVRFSAVVQFSRTLGMLIESGVNLAEALDIVVKIVDNKVLSQTLKKARDNIIKQGKIAQYLKETHIFPPLAIYLINTGEQSGELGSMLTTVALNYENDLKDRADNLSALLNPIMLFVIAAIVGFVILAVIGPMQDLTNKANESSQLLNEK